MENKDFYRNYENGAGFARVSAARNGRINTEGAVPFINAPVAVPYGIAYVVPAGEETFMLPIGNTAVSIGMIQKPCADIQAGEIMLYSQGGASVILKNDGRVLRNGREV